MTNRLWRLSFTLLLAALCAVIGWYAATTYTSASFFAVVSGYTHWAVPLYRGLFLVVGAIFGLGIGSWLFRRIEIAGERLRAMSTRDKIALGIGSLLGLLLTVAISIPVLIAFSSRLFFGVTITLLVGTALTYLCTVTALSLKEEIPLYIPRPAAQDEEEAPPAQQNWKILDTNVIIDGRISDVAGAGFIEGAIYVPGFVLDELQHIADSSDGLKRARGRRGLDILNDMQKELNLVVRSYDRLAPHGAAHGGGHEEVDARLVRLAKAMNGAIVTNDFNLNKVAEIQGVQVLNINELANALKPVVLPGEEMRVAIVKDGKEPSQGVGYLDDGTMIVVEGGRRHIGETVEVLVSSVLQTQAGKMIFAHLRGSNGSNGTGAVDNEGEGGDVDSGLRAYTRGGTRRPVRR